MAVRKLKPLEERNTYAGEVMRAWDRLFPTACRKCGCDNLHACKTESGPCHWVEPDLCSACAGEPGYPKEVKR